MTAEHVEQWPNRQVREEGMPKVRVAVHLIAVAAAFLDTHEEALGDEVGDDFLGGPFADSDARRDLADADGGLAGDAKQHIAVVRQDEPVRELGVFYRWLLNHGS